MTTLSDQQVHALRLDHRALRSERVRVTWWRRLVRAQLDLAVARTVGPQGLGEDLAFQLPLDIVLDVPRPAELDAVLGPRSVVDDVLMLERLRALDRRLARYQDGVETALTRANDALVTCLARTPAALLQAAPAHAFDD
jgi:hypothetical protein